MYFVIYSSDSYLLARLCTDLQMEGIPVDLVWAEYFHPLKTEQRCTYLHIDEMGIGFYSHDECSKTPPQNRFTLTSRNYLKVLGEIVRSKPDKNLKK